MAGTMRTYPWRDSTKRHDVGVLDVPAIAACLNRALNVHK